MADRFGMERPTYFPSLFVLLPPSARHPAPLASLDDDDDDERRCSIYVTPEVRRSSRPAAAKEKKKKKKERARRMETRRNGRAALLERHGNESFVDGRVRVDHKKRITGTMSRYG